MPKISRENEPLGASRLLHLQVFSDLPYSVRQYCLLRPTSLEDTKKNVRLPMAAVTLWRQHRKLDTVMLVECKGRYIWKRFNDHSMLNGWNFPSLDVSFIASCTSRNFYQLQHCVVSSRFLADSTARRSLLHPVPNTSWVSPWMASSSTPSVHGCYILLSWYLLKRKEEIDGTASPQRW